MVLPKIKRALISVYDKTGLVEFTRALVDEFGIEIISTGGTAKHLKENKIPVTLVEDITGFPEMLDGRVKTLHPKIHAGILADRDNPEHMRQLEAQGIKPIDMVVVNLYPFEKTVADPNCTFDQAIEMIDIGGPCMLRAAAKNHKHVLSFNFSFQYDDVLEQLRGTLSASQRLEHAEEAFQQTSIYDADVATWLAGKLSNRTPFSRHVIMHHGRSLRYGENPHQKGWYYAPSGDMDFNALSVQLGQQRVTTELSFNNFMDASAAFELCRELTLANGESRRSVVVFVKHTNACGVGVAETPELAYEKAYAGDPNAAMGGILACNFEINLENAAMIMDTYDRWGRALGAGGFFVEVWLAPSFSNDQVLELIQSRKNWGSKIRLLDTGYRVHDKPSESPDYRRVTGGMLVQDRDLVGLNENEWKVVSKRKPTESEISDMRLAWLVAKHTKSNAISICKDGMLIGNGAGQMSRVMSCRIATWLAKENRHEGKLRGSVAASDAFFPFPDGPEILIDAGVSAIIQPGGSKRDIEVIAVCDARSVAMIFTGTRHFKH